MRKTAYSGPPTGFLKYSVACTSKHVKLMLYTTDKWKAGTPPFKQWDWNWPNFFVGSELVCGLQYSPQH